ncbi:MAG TPA: hypothetical protein VJJ72_02690, partial [Candidatus Paceibacterota bacterium]
MKRILFALVVLVLTGNVAEAQVGRRVPTGPQDPLSNNVNYLLSRTCAGVWIDSIGCVRVMRYGDIYMGVRPDGGTFPFADALGRPIGPRGSAVIGAIIGAGGGYALGRDSRSTVGGMTIGAILGLLVDKTSKQGEYDRLERSMQAFARAGGQYPQARVQTAQQNPPVLPQLPPPDDSQTFTVPPEPPQAPLVPAAFARRAVRLENGGDDWVEVFFLDPMNLDPTQQKILIGKLPGHGMMMARY